jgi:hypothetical protein
MVYLTGVQTGNAWARVQEQAVLAGTQLMRLYLLPSAQAVLCEWDPFLDLVGLHYGPEIAGPLPCVGRAPYIIVRRSYY